MKETALLISLFGLISLVLIMNFYPVIRINSQEDINKMLTNQRVEVKSTVKEIKHYSNYDLISLKNNLTLYCYCKSLPNLINKNITAVGIIDTFQKNKIKVLKLEY